MTPPEPEKKAERFPHELRRIRWRIAMLAAGRVAELCALGRAVKWQEKLTYNPEIVP
jgi:hypothetical protein